jgi:hypothetical protein
MRLFRRRNPDDARLKRLDKALKPYGGYFYRSDDDSADSAGSDPRHPQQSLLVLLWDFHHFRPETPWEALIDEVRRRSE